MNRIETMRASQIKETMIESLTFENHTIERYAQKGKNHVRITEPDGTVFDNMIFGPSTPDTLEAMLAWHRKGKPKDTHQLTERELIEALTRRVEALEARISKTDDLRIPGFLAESVPHEMADLIDWTAPPKERQDALLVKLNEVNGLIGLAEDRGGRATPDLYRKRDRLESGIHFNRPTLTETI